MSSMTRILRMTRPTSLASITITTRKDRMTSMIRLCFLGAIDYLD